MDLLDRAREADRARRGDDVAEVRNDTLDRFGDGSERARDFLATIYADRDPCITLQGHVAAPHIRR
jgi:hypothetical protein